MIPIHSEAEAESPDVSLAGDAGTAYTHRALTYPFGREGPGVGDLIEIAEGVHWVRLPLPGSLRHINLWVLDDSDSVTLVDTGLNIDACREAWELLLAGPLGGRKISRIIVTHFHPDHLGLAGWLAERFSASLWMTRSEWLFGRMLAADVREGPPKEAFAYWRAAGWDNDRVEAEAAKGWGRFASVVSPIPANFVRLCEGDRIRIGTRDWRVVVGTGHSPEHACLVDEQGGLMVAGDQVLPKITSNVSLSLSEPEGDPLGDWLSSITKFKELPADLLVLPSHGEPFYGLHARLDALERGHLDRLDALHAYLAEPRRAIDCFSILFGRQITDSLLALATGEAMAHLRRLELDGRAVRDLRNGVYWFSQTKRPS